MLPFVQVGPLTLRTPGLALLAGFWIGLEISSRFGRRRGICDDVVYNVGFWVVLGAVLAARFVYVLLNLGVYTGIEPLGRGLLAVIAPVPGNENPIAGVLVGIGIFIYLARRNGVDLLTLLDAFVPTIALMAAAIGLSNLFGGDLYGIEANIPWSIELWGAERHPTQLYLFGAGLLILASQMWLEYRSDSDLEPGAVFQIGMLALGAALLLIEPFRADSPVILDGIRLWQVIALGVMLLSLSGFVVRSPRKPVAEKAV